MAQNTGENKMDFYLTRHINYSASVTGDGALEGEVRIDFRNIAKPGTSFPDYVGGPRPHLDLGEGRIRDFLSLFVPKRAQLQEVLRNDVPTTDFETSTERGKQRLAAYVELGPGESETLAFRYRLPAALEDGVYRLVIQKQSTVHPDSMSIQIQSPKGWVSTNKQGFGSGGNLVWKGLLTSDLELSAQLRAPLANLILGKITGFLARPAISLAGNR
jgi:hypothetical protein